MCCTASHHVFSAVHIHVSMAPQRQSSRARSAVYSTRRPVVVVVAEKALDCLEWKWGVRLGRARFRSRSGLRGRTHARWTAHNTPRSCSCSYHTMPCQASLGVRRPRADGIRPTIDLCDLSAATTTFPSVHGSRSTAPTIHLGFTDPARTHQIEATLHAAARRRFPSRCALPPVCLCCRPGLSARSPAAFWPCGLSPECSRRRRGHARTRPAALLPLPWPAPPCTLQPQRSVAVNRTERNGRTNGWM